MLPNPILQKQILFALHYSLRKNYKSVQGWKIQALRELQGALQIPATWFTEVTLPMAEKQMVQYNLRWY